MKHNKTAQSWVENTVQCTEKCSDQKLTNIFEVTVRGIVVRPPHIVTEVAGRLQDDQMSSVPCTCALLRKPWQSRSNKCWGEEAGACTPWVSLQRLQKSSKCLHNKRLFMFYLSWRLMTTSILNTMLLQRFLDYFSHCYKKKSSIYKVTKKLSEWKQAHVGIEPSKPTKLDGNDTTILSHNPYILWHFVNWIQFCNRIPYQGVQ